MITILEKVISYCAIISVVSILVSIFNIIAMGILDCILPPENDINNES